MKDRQLTDITGPSMSTWSPCREKRLAVAIFNFSGCKVQHGLTIEIGDTVNIIEECAGWYRGFNVHDRKTKGIFPCTYVALKPFRYVDACGISSCSIVMSDVSIQACEDAVSLEIVSSLREWHVIWRKQLFLTGDRDTFDTVASMILQLIEQRRLLLAGNLTQDEVHDVKLKITRTIDTGNRILSLDFIPRDESTGAIIDSEQVSPIDLYKIHLNSLDATHRNLHSRASGATRSSISSHTSISSGSLLGASISKFIYMYIRELQLPASDDSFELHFSIYNPIVSSHVSEKFVHYLSRNHADTSNFPSANSTISSTTLSKGTTSTWTFVSSGDLLYNENISTIFTDIAISDISSDLILLIQVYRIGKILPNEGKSKLSSASLLPLAVSYATQSASSAGVSNNTSSQSTVYNTAHNSNNGNNGRVNDPAGKFKRPFGVAIVQLAEIIKTEDVHKEIILKLHTSSNENDFGQLHDLLIRKQSNKVSVVPNSTIIMTLRSFSGTELKAVKSQNPSLFSNASCLTPRKGFPDIVLPGDVRNDLYISLDSGEFEKGGKAIPKNIEATITLFTSCGKLIENAISPGSGVPLVTTYSTCIIYHTNSPRWYESIKLLIPLEIFDLEAHIRIEFRHCSAKEGNKDKKLIGFSFIPINDEVGTILSDGLHELYLYKSSDLNNKNKCLQAISYTCLAYGPRDNRKCIISNVTGGYTRSAKEIIHIRTQLSSTKLTQNSDLLLLLKWRSSPTTIEESLRKLLRVNGEEIVKFLQDILDALFSMFSSHDGSSTHYTDIVFRGFIHIFCLLDQPKYEHFKPVLDTYIHKHFAAALIYKGLLDCVKKCACNIVVDCDKATVELSQKCFKSLRWMFKFIVQSRILFTRATINSDDSKELFRQDLISLFSCISNMLSINHSSVVTSQTIFVENFSSTFEQVLRVLTPLDVAIIVKLVFNESNLVANDTCGSLVRAKLECFQEIIENNEVMSNYEARRELIHFLSNQLRCHVDQKQELKLCCRLICDILVSLHSQKVASSGYGNSINHLVELFVGNLLSALCRVIIDLSTSPAVHYNTSLCSSLVNEFIVCLLSLFRLMEDAHFSHFMSVQSRREKKDTLLRIFYIFKHSFAHDLLPNDWSSLRMVFNHIILCTMQELSMTLITDFLDCDDVNSYDAVTVGTFDEDLWKGYFSLSVSFLTQDCLQLETFTSQKRRNIIDKYGDMRVLMGFQILPMWEKLGELKIHFIPAMVAPFLEVTLVPEKELRTATIPIFYDMIDAEVKATASFKIVSSQLIDKLDHLVGEERKGDVEFKQLLQTILLERIRQCTPTWKEQGIQFVNSISKLLELLLDYRLVMGGEENRDKHMSCTVNLLRFYKEDINRSEMYLRYIHKLSDLHIPSGNFTEAAFTLKLHADILKWSTNLIINPIIHSIESSAPQDRVQFRELPEWQVKEKLYLDIIDYFDKGKCWEEGVPLIEELSDFYKKQLFDYRKLSQLYKTHSRFLDNILSALRPEPEYFRVGFFGQGFPSFLRNKLFIYRGLEYEKIGAFTTRLQAEFPQSSLLTKSGPPDDSVILSDEQHIQVCSVRPIPESRSEFEGQAVPDEILSYYLTNDVRSFIYDRPIHKGPVDKVNEFKSLWIERSILTTAAKLPGILRWSEVVSKKIIEVSPIEHACETVEKMVRELEKLVTSYNHEPGKAIHPLSMRLQGVIEATVNGGIAKYQDAFFNANYIALYSEQLPCIRKLKQLINHQVRILEGGLSLHGRLAPNNVQPLHKRLVETFTLMRQRFHDSSSHIDAGACVFDSFTLPSKRPSIINTPLPPIPRSTSNKHALIESESESGYQLIRPEARANHSTRRNSNDDIYSIPIEKCINTTSEQVSSIDQESSTPCTRERVDESSRSLVTCSSDVTEPTPLLPERGSPAPPPPLPPSRYRVNPPSSSNGSHAANASTNSAPTRSQTRSVPNTTFSDNGTNQPLFVVQTTVTTSSSSSSSPSSSSSSSSHNGGTKTLANSNFYSPCPLTCKKASNKSDLSDSSGATPSLSSASSSTVPVAIATEAAAASSAASSSHPASATSPPPPLPPRNCKDHSSKSTNHSFSTLPVVSLTRSVDVPLPAAPALPSRKTLTKSISSETSESPSSPEVRGLPPKRSASTRRPPPPTPVASVNLSDEVAISSNLTAFTNGAYISGGGSEGVNNERVDQQDESSRRDEQVIASSSISVVPVVNDCSLEEAHNAQSTSNVTVLLASAEASNNTE